MTGLVFQECHQYQSHYEGSDEEVQRRSVAVRRFFDDRYQDRTGNAGSPPSRQDTAVNGAEILGPKKVAEVSRHAGKTAAIASNDEQEEDLEAESAGYIGKLPEGQDFNGEE